MTNGRQRTAAESLVIGDVKAADVVLVVVGWWG